MPTSATPVAEQVAFNFTIKNFNLDLWLQIKNVASDGSQC
jgi:hypothetical protein